VVLLVELLLFSYVSPELLSPRVNCPFYFKMGACRHGDRCSRAHNQPVFSQTVCLVHLYQNPEAKVVACEQQGLPPPDIDRREIEEGFLNFYEEIHEELSKFGEIEELNVCDNLGDHMIGTLPLVVVACCGCGCG
jgi:splicing factor U2AF subunit